METRDSSGGCRGSQSLQHLQRTFCRVLTWRATGPAGGPAVGHRFELSWNANVDPEPDELLQFESCKSDFKNIEMKLEWKAAIFIQSEINSFQNVGEREGSALLLHVELTNGCFYTWFFNVTVLELIISERSQINAHLFIFSKCLDLCQTIFSLIIWLYWQWQWSTSVYILYQQLLNLKQRNHVNKIQNLSQHTLCCRCSCC